MIKLEKYDRTIFLKEGLFSRKGNNILDQIRNQKQSKEAEKAIKKLEKNYKSKIPDIISNLIKNKDPFLFQYKNIDVMLLGHEIILDANKFFDYNLTGLKYIPIIDLSEDDIICFDLNSNTFKIFNIIDEMEFGERKTLEKTLDKFIKEN